jgi:hypothetical protein
MDVTKEMDVTKDKWHQKAFGEFFAGEDPISL